MSFDHIKKLTVIVALTIMLANHANAQLGIGVEAGINRNYLGTNSSDRSAYEIKPGGGISAGILLQYQWKDWLALTAIPGFQQKKYSIDRTGTFTGVGETVSNTYIQLPVMATMQWKLKQFAVYANAGLYGAYWAAGRQKGTIPDIFHSIDSVGDDGQMHSALVLVAYNKKYQFDKRKDNRWEAGWVAGIGTTYTVNQQWRVYTEAKMYNALTGMKKNYMINRQSMYNRTVSIAAGCIMNIKRKNSKQ